MTASTFRTSTNLRFFYVCEKPCKILNLLGGYGNKPLVSLEEAVKPLLEQVHDIKIQAQQAKAHAHTAGDMLTADEAAAIYLYTSECVKNLDSLYTSLQKTLHLQNQDSLMPWLLYMKLLLSALFKLPSMRCLAWR
ncbi:unnamed protein product [Rotaria magnacalcarata]|uniref:Uncharacterized protein n=3 Tax=Rotaria magnacalcarata TaxID=392030 RepID=A0A816WGB9_9BILA|nr:unnamed protein product [Rotaria magnacalcarata]